MPDEVKPVGEVKVPPVVAEVVATPPVVEKTVKAEVPKTEEKPGETKVEAVADPKSILAEAPKVEEGKPAEIKLEIPKDSGLTAEQVKAVETLAKEDGLTQVQAQKLVERKAAEAKAAKESYTKTFTTWADESKKQYGEKLPAMVQSAQRALRMDPDFTDADRALVNTTPYGNHAFLIKVLAKLGERYKEDAAPSGTQAPPKEKSVVDRFYPKGATKTKV